MKVLILNGNPKAKNERFEEYIQELALDLKQNGHNTIVLNLKEMEINRCIGCYSCWLKTPGKCIFNDDGPQILKEYLKADFVLFASPIIMGFISSLLKGVQERCLPLVLPFLYVKNDRMQHISRYEKYPAIALLLDHSEDYDQVSAEIIEKVFRSSNSRKFLFTKTMNNSPEEVAYAINSI
ncbi:flavodoxin family protein [Desulfosporosinus sp. SYSU MS00001]|uniref:flavodoxin family protein n=1 Tax=Desulfosporosinus sp. SYSU MS00001 TaxID=3416284 RepID=UPI003CEBFA48